jgi:hypothetical protein
MIKPLATSLSLPSLGLIALALVLPSCGDDSSIEAFQPAQRKTAKVDADAGKLVAADALAVARVQNIGGVIERVKAIAESFQPGAGMFVDVTPLLVMIGLRPKDLDMSGSPLLTMGMTPTGPMSSYILPAVNAEESSDVTPFPSVVSGKYLGIGMGSQPVVGSSAPAIVDGLPDADLAARVNLKALLTPFRPLIDQYVDPEFLATLDPSVKADPAGFEMLGTMAKSVKEMMDVAKQLDLAVSVKDGVLDFDVSLKVSGGGIAAPSGHAVTLARMLPLTDASMYLFTDFDWSLFVDKFLPMYEAMAASMPGERGKAFLKLMESSAELYKGMKGGIGFALDLTDKGIQGMGLMESDDPAGFTDRYIAFMKDYPKFLNAVVQDVAVGAEMLKCTAPVESEVEGIEFKTFTMEMDMESVLKAGPARELPEKEIAKVTAAMDGLMGKGGLRMALGVHENLVLMAVGDVDAHTASLASSVKNGQKHKNAFVEYVAERLHARPIYFFGGDVRRVARQFGRVLGKFAPMPVPEVPAGDPVFAWMSVSSTGDSYGLQIHLDLAGIAEIVKAMNPR